MKINGSPKTLDLFGISPSISPKLNRSPTESQELFPSTERDTSSQTFDQLPNSNVERICFPEPQPSSQTSSFANNEADAPSFSSAVLSSVSSLSASVNKSARRIYSSQEVRESSGILQSDVWKAVTAICNNEVLRPYNVKNILDDTCLYRGKTAHLAVMIKSVECLSHKDSSLLLYDGTGEIKGTLHKRVLEKYGSLIEEGAALLLRQCTIFSFLSVQKYINVTLPNVVHIFNQTSLSPPQEILDKHLLEVSEINVQKEENPDHDRPTPYFMMNTPNRPPPPRSFRSTPQTPQLRQQAAHANQQTPQTNQRTPKRCQQTPQSSRSCHYTPTSHPKDRQPLQKQHIKQLGSTKARNSLLTTPQRDSNQRAPIQNKQFQESPYSLANQQAGTKRLFSPAMEKESAKKVKVKNSSMDAKSSNLTHQEEEDIAKLLEEIDQSFFDDF